MFYELKSSAKKANYNKMLSKYIINENDFNIKVLNISKIIYIAIDDYQNNLIIYLGADEYIVISQKEENWKKDYNDIINEMAKFLDGLKPPLMNAAY